MLEYYYHFLSGEFSVGKKSIFTSILFGALFAASFVLTKSLFDGTLMRPEATRFVHRKAGSMRSEDITESAVLRQNATPMRDLWEQAKNVRPYDVDDNLDVEGSAAGSMKASTPTRDVGEYLFFMDYPRSTLPDVTEIIYNNNIMVDAPTFTQNYGIELLYNRGKGTLTLIFNDDTLIFNLVDWEVKFNNVHVETEQFAILKGDILFIPLPLTAQMFGIKVKSNDLDRIFTIGGIDEK